MSLFQTSIFVVALSFVVSGCGEARSSEHHDFSATGGNPGPDTSDAGGGGGGAGGLGGGGSYGVAGSRGCIVEGQTYSDGDVVRRSSCTSCLCDDGELSQCTGAC